MVTVRKILASITLLVPCLVAAQDRPLSPDDVKASWVGKAAIGTTTTGMPVEMRLQADGSATVVAGSTSDSGTWRTFDKGFCTTWKKIRASQERCFTGVVKDSTVVVFNPDGTEAGKYTLFK